jgi:hypothetical protein
MIMTGKWMVFDGVFIYARLVSINKYNSVIFLVVIERIFFSSII